MVEVDAGVTCQRCASGKGCGAGLLAGDPQSKVVAAILGADISVARGDQVRLEMRPARGLQGAIIVYGYPLGGAVGGAVIAATLSLADAAAVIAVVLGFATGFLLAKIRVAGDRCLRDFTPVIADKLVAPGKG